MSKSPNLITRLTLILFGVFLTSFLYAMSIRAFELSGLLIGTFINIALSAAGLYYTPKKSQLHIISWTILATTIVGIITYFVSVGYISSSLEL
jgi:hypothetical protein